MTYDFLLNGTQPSHSVITQQEAGLNLLGELSLSVRMSAWVLQLLPTVQRYVGTGVGVIGDPTMNADVSLC